MKKKSFRFGKYLIAIYVTEIPKDVVTPSNKIFVQNQKKELEVR